MINTDHLVLAKLIGDVIERMPRSDPEALALRISLDQAGYEIRRKAAAIPIIDFSR